MCCYQTKAKSLFCICNQRSISHLIGCLLFVKSACDWSSFKGAYQTGRTGGEAFQGLCLRTSLYVSSNTTGLIIFYTHVFLSKTSGCTWMKSFNKALWNRFTNNLENILLLPILCKLLTLIQNLPEIILAVYGSFRIIKASFCNYPLQIWINEIISPVNWK